MKVEQLEDLERLREFKVAAQKEIDRLNAKVEAAEAVAKVHGGEWCRSNRAAGRGPCGACSLCCKEATDEVDRLKAEVEASKRWEMGLRAVISRFIGPRDTFEVDDAVKHVDRLKGDVERLKADLTSSRSFTDVLSRACSTLRAKVTKYLEVSSGENSSEASWDAWEDMRIALGAFATDNDVHDWEAELFAARATIDEACGLLRDVCAPSKEVPLGAILRGRAFLVRHDKEGT